MFKHFALVICALLLSACTQPFIGIPGGKLTGSESSAPSSWPTLPDVVQIEVRPDDPYSLNIWAVNAGEHIYVATREAKWVPFIEADNRMRLKVEDNIYAVAASAVTDEDERTSVAAAYEDKYEYEGAIDDSIVVYRLSPQ